MWPYYSLRCVKVLPKEEQVDHGENETPDEVLTVWAYAHEFTLYTGVPTKLWVEKQALFSSRKSENESMFSLLPCVINPWPNLAPLSTATADTSGITISGIAQLLMKRSSFHLGRDTFDNWLLFGPVSCGGHASGDCEKLEACRVCGLCALCILHWCNLEPRSDANELVCQGSNRTVSSEQVNRLL